LNEQAFIWDSINQMQPLGSLGGEGSYAMAINESNQVVGYQKFSGGSEDQAFIWDSVNGMQPIGDFGASSMAYDINEAGQVTGHAWSLSSNTWHIFLWDSINGIQDLGALFEDTTSNARAINNSSQIVGFAYITGGNSKAFIWEPERGFIDLNTLVPPDSGWELERAHDINDSGQIIGYGIIQGEKHGFLLTPVSELFIDAILNFFDESVDDGTLEGDGSGNSANNRLNALRNMLAEAGVLIDSGMIEEACGQLMTVYRKCDGAHPPPDFVIGDAVSELSNKILELMEYLGCE
jgi:probable HAF family extracellular repeat protein